MPTDDDPTVVDRGPVTCPQVTDVTTNIEEQKILDISCGYSEPNRPVSVTPPPRIFLAGFPGCPTTCPNIATGSRNIHRR
ncbi:hypothetical protein [Micromonospora sp. HUAS LYJ1]|uniref:hypothetical protein n=1 Tax=Micromonospora sp. HUAS LYJ1 TaxID=3061626 RepID=UPI002673DF43|nr:hypothetical protein [Micromonospora sp. HUAS LYJ1]WKU04873.1 hypothetical protein Q2K16_29545 [Micromonospora sp. HUAS LYJ1]